MRYENEFKLYQQTKLLADKNIQFPAKLKFRTPITSQYTPPPLFEFGRKSNRN